MPGIGQVRKLYTNADLFPPRSGFVQQPVMTNSIQILSPFEHFDPLDGLPCHHFFEEATLIASRARRLLKGRSREQILYMVETINYMFDYRDPFRVQLERLLQKETMNQEAFDEELKISKEENNGIGRKAGLVRTRLQANPDHSFLTATQVLKMSMEIFDISDQAKLLKARWFEYFAVLALALIGESQLYPNWITRDQDIDEHFQDLLKGRHVGHYMLDAMDSVGYAERIRDQEERKDSVQDEVEKKVQEKIRLNGREGGVKGHAETNRIKRDFIRFVEESYLPALPPGEKLNKTAAAREFYDEFLADKAPNPETDFDSAFKHKENWIRLLNTALRAHLKKQNF